MIVPRGSRREAIAGGLALVVMKLALAPILFARGFTHVSDDDFSRVVIAQVFARAPRLDPSGTSWLPFPFWLTGAWMMAFGRSLGSAQVLAIVLGAIGPLFVYGVMRRRGDPAPLLLTAIAFVSPWPAWLGVATVPESLTSALACAGVLAIARKGALDRLDAIGGALLLCACLSRYDAWPMALTAAAIAVARARASGAKVIASVTIALLVLGPLGWMLWNRHAHGDALHFFARVSRFRQASGQSTSGLDAWLFYPRAIATVAPDVTAFALVAIGAVLRDKTLRARWGAPLLACGATFAFLVIGAARDGAPTHHPARALVVTFPILAAAGVDSLREMIAKLAPVRAPLFALGAAALLLLLAWSTTEMPGTSAAEDRRPQVTRGLALARDNAAHVVLTPCAYEHFALIAAFGAPERVTIVDGATKTTPDERCPAVLVTSM